MGIDNGFRILGWCTYNLITNTYKNMGIIDNRIDKESKKDGMGYKQDFPRCQKFARNFAKLMHQHQPDAFCIETSSGFRTSRSALSMGMANGILFSTIALLSNKPLPIEIIQPSLIKSLVYGGRVTRRKGQKTDKDMVERFAYARFPSLATKLKTVPAYKRNHIIDAMCTIQASLTNAKGMLRHLKGNKKLPPNVVVDAMLTKP